MLFHDGPDDIAFTGFQCCKRTSLILVHEARIADHIGGKYGSEAALHS
jgi:hypothetical protein